MPGFFPCQWPDCLATYERKDLLRVHVNRKHTMEKPFACKTCHRGFADRGSRDAHQATVHSDQRSHTCEHCNRSFKRRAELNRHFREKHARVTTVDDGHPEVLELVLEVSATYVLRDPTYSMDLDCSNLAEDCQQLETDFPEKQSIDLSTDLCFQSASTPCTPQPKDVITDWTHGTDNHSAGDYASHQDNGLDDSEIPITIISEGAMRASFDSSSQSFYYDANTADMQWSHNTKDPVMGAPPWRTHDPVNIVNLGAQFGPTYWIVLAIRAQVSLCLVQMRVCLASQEEHAQIFRETAFETPLVHLVNRFTGGRR